MSPTKQVRFLAKGILDSCKKDGALDALALKKFISILANSEEAIAGQILSCLAALADEHERKNTLAVESAFDLEVEQLEALKKYFETKESKKLGVSFSINKDLVGGLKLRLGDFVWENSVMSNLATLENIMTYD